MYGTDIYRVGILCISYARMFGLFLAPYTTNLTSFQIAAVLLLSIIFLRETYAPTILKRKTMKLNKGTTDSPYRSKYHSDLPTSALFKRAIVRPIKMLFNPIVFLLSAYMAVVYGYLVYPYCLQNSAEKLMLI